MSKQVEFFGAQLLKTKALFDSVKSNSMPSWLAPHVSIETNGWMLENGHSEFDSSSVLFPSAGYEALLCSDDQAEYLQLWLDMVCPGWKASRDGYGNPCVTISELVQDQLENLVSPEARGDYV